VLIAKNRQPSRRRGTALQDYKWGRANLFGIRALEAGVDGGIVQATTIPKQPSVSRQQRLIQGRRKPMLDQLGGKASLPARGIPDKRWLDGNAVGFDMDHQTDIRDIGLIVLQHPVPLHRKAPMLNMPLTDIPHIPTPEDPSSTTLSASTQEPLPKQRSQRVSSLPPPPHFPMTAIRHQRSKSCLVSLHRTEYALLESNSWSNTICHDFSRIPNDDPFWSDSGSSGKPLESQSPRSSEPHRRGALEYVNSSKLSATTLTSLIRAEQSGDDTTGSTRDMSGQHKASFSGTFIYGGSLNYADD